MTCPQPKRCAYEKCGRPVPSANPRARYCTSRCRNSAHSLRSGRTAPGFCSHCTHCAAEVALRVARETVLQEVAERLEAQEWRSAAAAVRDMDLQSPGGDA